jgi:hypothetical protein
MIKKLLAGTGILLCLLGGKGIAQNNFYDPLTVQEIRIFFSQTNWDFQMDTANL